MKGVLSNEAVQQLKKQLATQIQSHLPDLLPEEAYKRISTYDVETKDFWAEVPAVQTIHKIAPSLMELLQESKILEALHGIIPSKNIKCIQSIYFVKSPGSIGTPWHQDEFYLPTRDRSLTAVWISLSEANKENGGVDVIPKSHQAGVLYQLDPKDYERNIKTIDKWNTKDAVCLETQEGDVALFNGYLLHSSGINLSQNAFREAVVFHVMSSESLFPYRPDDNFEGKRLDPADFRDFFQVSGIDPYSFKGKEDLYKPYIQKPHNIYQKAKNK